MSARDRAAAAQRKHFSQMTYEEQREYIKSRRDKETQRTVAGHVECSSPDCERDLTGAKCLRANFSPPNKPWAALRFCDLACLLDFLIAEEEAEGSGQVFTEPEFVDRHLAGAVPAKVAADS